MTDDSGVFVTYDIKHIIKVEIPFNDYDEMWRLMFTHKIAEKNND